MQATHHGQEAEGLLSEEVVGDTQELSTSVITFSGHASSTPAATVTMRSRCVFFAVHEGQVCWWWKVLTEGVSTDL